MKKLKVQLMKKSKGKLLKLLLTLRQEQKKLEQLQKRQESVINKIDVFGPLTQEVTMLQKQAPKKHVNATNQFFE